MQPQSRLAAKADTTSLHSLRRLDTPVFFAGGGHNLPLHQLSKLHSLKTEDVTPYALSRREGGLLGKQSDSFWQEYNASFTSEQLGTV
jgi:hypothetical protein